MAVNNNYRHPNKIVAMTENYLRDLAKIVDGLVNGKTNNTGEVTLTENVASTQVKNILVDANSVVLLVPTTANGALEATSGSLYLVPGDKIFTIYHDNNALTDRTFKYIVVG